MIVCTGTTGQSCQYACRAGFDDSGHGEVVCGTDGNFPTVSCGGQKCNDKSISHTTAGQTKCAGHTEDLCRFTCASGYENPFRRSGSATNLESVVKCQPNHSFEDGDCVPKDCEDLTIGRSALTTTTPWSPDRETTCGGKFDGPACAFSCAQGFGIGGQSNQLSGSILCKSRMAGQPSFDSTACTDIDECADNNAGCSPGAVCVNTEGSFFCAGCQGMQQGVAGACCNPNPGPGGTRTSGPAYGPTALCCAPAPAPVAGLAPPPPPPDGADCSINGSPGYCNVLATSHSWLNDADGQNTGCIGIPVASQTQVHLFAAIAGPSGIWTWYDFGTPLAAGTQLLIAIDPKDARGQRNAELQGLCEASTFSVLSEHDIRVGALQFFQEVVTDTHFCDGNLCDDIAEQYYAANLDVNKTGNYLLTVSSSSLAWHGAVDTGGTVTIVPDAPYPSQCEVTGNDVLSSLCLASGSCKSRPSSTELLNFGVKIYDRFKNPRNDQDAVDLMSDGVVKSHGSYSDQVFSIGFTTSVDSAAPLAIDIIIRCLTPTLPELDCFNDLTVQSFQFTVHAAAPDELNKLFSIGSGRNAQVAIFAGNEDPFTVIVSDDQCQGMATCNYWPDDPHDPCDCAPVDVPKGCTKRRLLSGAANVTGLDIPRRQLGRGGWKRCKTECSKRCVANPCGLPLCACPPYVTSIGCVESNRLEEDVHIVAIASQGVLPSDPIPKYDRPVTSTAKYPPDDCVEPSIANPVCLDFVFAPHIAGLYLVSLDLGSQGKLNFKGSEWEVVVNPAALDHDKSQPGHFFDFETSEAGRNNTFYIYPRDRFGNLRDQASPSYALENGIDSLSLTVRGPEFLQGTQGSSFWDSAEHRFEVMQRITVAGAYTFVVQMGGLEHDLVSKQVSVFAAATDVSNTRVELYSQGPKYPAEDGGDPGYVLELKSIEYSVETSAGSCTDMPTGQSAKQYALECSVICRKQARCRFFAVEITHQGNASATECCCKEDVDQSSPTIPHPPGGYALYRLVRQDPAPQPPLQPRATFAGATNLFWFTARDMFGNSRSNNDTCTVSYSAPGGQATVSQLWQDGRYAVTFRSTTSLPAPYHVSVALQTKDKTDGTPAESTPVPGSPFWVPVWPAGLDIEKSGQPGPQFREYGELDTAWLSTTTCGSPCRQMVAGAPNNFSVIPKDEFGNIQDRHPSIFALKTPDALFATLNCTTPNEADWCNLGDSHQMDTQWDAGVHLYRAQMNLFPVTQMGSYSLVVQLGNAASPGDDKRWEVRVAGRNPYDPPVSLPLSPVTVFVRPADLSPPDCGPGNGLDPELFHSTEAGRLSQFPVVPRDRYSNIRNQTLFALSDHVSIEIFEIPGMSAQTVDSIVWKENAPLWDSSNAPVRPHFAVSFQISQAGDYSLSIKIESPPGELREGLRRVAPALVGGGSPIPITVVPAALDAKNTRFLTTFNTNAGAQDAETVGALAARVFMMFVLACLFQIHVVC